MLGCENRNLAQGGPPETMGIATIVKNPLKKPLEDGTAPLNSLQKKSYLHLVNRFDLTSRSM
jgi:hypothetical protein